MNFHNKKYYSNGKLLLTGEYVVLHGAKALAFPTQYGQDLIIEENSEKGVLSWEAYASKELWFWAALKLPEFQIISTNDTEKANYLVSLLRNAFDLSGILLSSSKGYKIKTNADFPIEWGLGTSSTLINNIAQLAQINAFKLSFSISKGSGYDIACASINSPIQYKLLSGRKPEIKHINFNKSFLQNLYFVYSGKKKSTEKHIALFLENNSITNSAISTISGITEKVLETDDFDEFKSLIRMHEETISEILHEPEVQKEYFKSFEGVIKSLGAWGGDFMLAVTDKDEIYVQRYFEQFGLPTIIPFRKMILT